MSDEPTERPPVDLRAEMRRRILILADDPLAAFTGWRRRVAGFVWRFLGPSLQRQQEFNAYLADYLDVSMHEMRREEGEGLSSLADEMAKRWESTVVREKRYEARADIQARATNEVRTALAEVRTGIASVQHLSHALKREMERLLAGAQSPAAAGAPLLPSPPSLESWKYLGFEDQFRGSTEHIRASLSTYLGVFEKACDVLDVGCGRGEFLQLLQEQGIRARGVDLNHAMVDACRSRGLDVVEGEAVQYLSSLPDGSLGGLFAAQVIEHLTSDQIVQLIDLAYAKLRPGAPIVLETINPACWAAFFESYIRDLTHVRPVHPETLTYLLQASGFRNVEIRFSAPYPEHARLQRLAMPDRPDSDEYIVTDVINANVEKLNALLFTYFDYAGVGTRG